MPTIRLATPADGAAFAAIYGPVCLDTAISFETEAPTAEEMARRVAAVLPGLPWLVYEAEGEVLGYACAKPYNERAAYLWTLEATIYVAAAGRGRRIGSALYTALLALVTAQGYHSISAGITLPNAASVRLHEAFGFAPVGVYADAGFKHGAWHDVGYWRRELAPAALPPAPPTPLTELVGGPAWEAAIAAGLAAMGQPRALT